MDSSGKEPADMPEEMEGPAVEPADVSVEMEGSVEAQERGELSSEPENASKTDAENSVGNMDEEVAGKNKRKRESEEEEGGDEIVIDAPSTADSIVVTSEDNNAENSGDVDDVTLSPTSSKGVAKKSTAKGSARPGPLSKKPKQSQIEESSEKNIFASSDGTATSPHSKVTASEGVVAPQPVSYIALVPINQPSTSNSNNATSNRIMAVPVEQNKPGIPAFVTIPAAKAGATIVPAGNTAAQHASTGKNTTAQESSPPVPSETQETDCGKPQASSSFKSTAIRTKVVRADDDSRTPLIRVGEEKSTGRPKGSRKRGRPKAPYRHAQPVSKKKSEKKTRKTVSDFNSSDEEEDDRTVDSKMLNSEMAALFFKKFGESKPTRNKSLMDKLHESLFSEQTSESESEEGSETEDATIPSDETDYKVVNCPGPGKYEAFIGPLNNSKLSIIRKHETMQVKDHLYEVYKVRVTSSGREANSSILIPVSPGYKFSAPTKGQETPQEFSHTAHEDFSSTNCISPKFLEKLANSELKLRKYKDELKVLRTRYVELLKEYANRPQFSTVSDLVGAAAKFLTEDQLVFFLMQLKAGAHNMQGIRYSVREKVLALSIYQKSPEVYKWLRKLLNLPSKSVLERWLEDVGSQDPQLLKKLMYHVYATYNFKRKVF